MQLLRKKGLLDSPRVLFLPVDAISPNPNQPRRVFGTQELEELAGSIQALGLLQPLTVRLLALVENLQRKDLDFWEEALALDRLISVYHLSQEEAARRIGKSQSAVANKLRLLKLPEDTLRALRDGGCTERHARALLRLEDPSLRQKALEQILSRQLTVAQTDALVDQLLSPPPRTRTKRTFVVKDVRLFLNTLTRSMALMRSAGVDARCDRQDKDGEILLTIRIPQAIR